jgi:hypothetical protein
MSYSQVMESEREGLKPFRRALSKEDQQAFDRLFDQAKIHTSVGVYMGCPWPMETILLSICLEHWKMIEEILGLLKERKTQKIRGQINYFEMPPEFLFDHDGREVLYNFFIQVKA